MAAMTEQEREQAESVILRLHEALRAARVEATVRVVITDNQPRLRIASRERGEALTHVRAVVAQVLADAGVEFSDLMAN